MAKKDLRQHKTSKNWKLERNYRQIRNKDGQTIAYLITVEGQDITVTKEIYQAYSKADRRDRYLVEQDNHHGVTSYSDLGDSSLLSLEMSSEMSDGSMEESVIRQIMFKNLHLSLRMLTKSEREFIICRYWKGVTQAVLAEQSGTTQQMISYREKQILKKLKRIFSKL